jgi:hypothetical protein
LKYFTKESSDQNGPEFFSDDLDLLGIQVVTTTAVRVKRS